MLSLKQKMGYGVADVGASLTFVAINTWFLYFLTTIVGLGAFRAGLIFVIGRLFDALIDPLMGLISDRTRSKWGRRMPYIWLGFIPLSASFALLWVVPEASVGIRFLLSLLAFMLFSVLYTVVQVPYLALTPELAPDYDTRTSLTGFRVAFGTVASLLAAAGPPLVVSFFVDTAGGERWGWVVMGIIFGMITALAYLSMALSVQEPRQVMTEDTPGQRFTDRFADVASAFRMYGFKEVFALFISATIGLMMVNAMMAFFLESALLLNEADTSLVFGLLFGVAICALPLWNFLAVRMGKRYALMLGLCWLAVMVTLLVLLSPTGLSAFLLLMTAGAGLGLSAVMLFPWAMLPDVIEFGELASGQRQEGMVYALFTFGQKVAGSVGVFATAIMAELFGYQVGVIAQSARTIFGIKLFAGPLAALVFLITIIFVWRFPITRESHEAARRQLVLR